MCIGEEGGKIQSLVLKCSRSGKVSEKKETAKTTERRRLVAEKGKSSLDWLHSRLLFKSDL